MTSDERDPPRLRSLRHELPAELSRALENAADEEAAPAELEALRASMARASMRAGGFGARPARRPPIARRSVALAMTLAVGAGAGVAVSQGVFLDTGSSSEAASPKLPDTGTGKRTNGDSRATKKTPVAPPMPPEETMIAPPNPTPESAPLAAGSARSRTTAVASSLTERAPETPADRDELVLLARAQAALATDPATALKLAVEHAQTFRGGTLAQEREVIAIDALSRLGRKGEAAARAQRFHRQFPASAHARRVDVLVGVPGDAGENHK